MKKINLDNIEVLAGLEWTALPADQPEKKAFSDFLSNNKTARHGVILRSNGIVVVGRPDAESVKIKTGKTPSAIALLALANQSIINEAGGLSSEVTSEEHNWIIAQAIDGSEDSFWMGAVKNGVPVPGCDILGSREKIIESITDLINIQNNFVVYTIDKEVRYNVVAQVTVVEKSFADLVRSVPTKKAELALFSMGIIVTVSIITLSVILIGGWWAYSSWSNAKKAEEAKKAMLAQQQAQKEQTNQATSTYQQAVKLAVLKALKDGMNDVNISLSSPSPRENINAWRSLIYKIDLYQSGWNMNSINCALEGLQPLCTINLKRGDIGTNRTLLDDHPDAIVNGDKASYVVREKELAPRQGSFKNLGSSIDFEKGLLSDLQELRQAGLQHTVIASKDVVKSVTLPPQPPSASVTNIPGHAPAPPAGPSTISIQLGVANGSITIEGNQLWELSGIAKYLDLINIRVKDLSVSIKPQNISTIRWRLNVDYFIRSLSQPIIPPIIVGGKNITIELPSEYRSTTMTVGGIASSKVTAIISTSKNTVKDNSSSNNNPSPSAPLPPQPH